MLNHVIGIGPQLVTDPIWATALLQLCNFPLAILEIDCIDESKWRFFGGVCTANMNRFCYWHSPSFVMANFCSIFLQCEMGMDLVEVSGICSYDLVSLEWRSLWYLIPQGTVMSWTLTQLWYVSKCLQIMVDHFLVRKFICSYYGIRMIFIPCLYEKDSDKST
jgi:hypothetical protein